MTTPSITRQTNRWFARYTSWRSRAGRDGEARDQIAYIVSQFVGFQQLQRPFQQAFEEVAKVAAKFPEVEQEAVALRAAVDERDAAVAAADARAAAVEERLAEALAEIDQQRAQIVELEGARAERRSPSLSRRSGRTGHRARNGATEAAVRESALAQAEREAVERAAEAEAIRQRSGRCGTAWDSSGRSTATRRRDAGVRGEVAALRGTLARAEGEARQRAATAAGVGGRGPRRCAGGWRRPRARRGSAPQRLPRCRPKLKRSRNADRGAGRWKGRHRGVPPRHRGTGRNPRCRGGVAAGSHAVFRRPAELLNRATAVDPAI